MNKILTVDIQLDQPKGVFIFELGEEVTGEIVVSPRESIELNYLSYRIELGIKGKLSPKTEILFSKTLLKHACLEAGEDYRYPIRFQNTKYESYLGKHVSFYIQVVVEAKPEEEERLPFLQAINPFSERTNWEKTVYPEFIDKTGCYSIQKEDIVLKSKAIFNIAFVLIFLLIPIPIYLLYPFDFQWIFVIAALALFLLLGHYMLGWLLFQKLSIAVSQTNEEEFAIVLPLQNKRLIQQISIDYLIVEEVIDRRGQDPEAYKAKTYREVLYESITQKFDYPLKTIKTAFLFPPKTKNRASFVLEDVRIYWLFKAKIDTVIGLSFSYEGEFMVKKTTSISKPQK